MKRFVWRLQRILDIKTKAEQIKKAELLALTGRLTRTRSELLMQKALLKEIISGIAEKQPQKRLSEQEFFLKYSVTADELIKRLEGKISELEAQQREKIAEVLKIKRFREGLEKLRAQAKANFIAEQEKLEQKELDEMAAIGFVRQTDPLLREVTQ